MIARFVFVVVMSSGLLSFVPPATAAQPYCPDATHTTSAKVPANLVAPVARALQIDESLARDTGFVRCTGSTLLACTIGANLDCAKADTRRALPGVTAWCRTNPGSKVVPMAASGHDTIYEWTCKGTHAVAARTIAHVDPRGYIAENWKEVR